MSCPTGKICHPTKEAALLALEQVKKSKKRDDPTLRAYLCSYAPRYAPHYHIGHDRPEVLRFVQRLPIKKRRRKNYTIRELEDNLHVYCNAKTWN